MKREKIEIGENLGCTIVLIVTIIALALTAILG